jgi:predicted nuclease of predicted toxin-antitoxin system
MKLLFDEQLSPRLVPMLADLAIALGTPPQIVWLRLGNCSTTTIERILRRHAAALSEFGADPEAAVLTIEQ